MNQTSRESDGALPHGQPAERPTARHGRTCGPPKQLRAWYQASLRRGRPPRQRKPRLPGRWADGSIHGRPPPRRNPACSASSTLEITPGRGRPDETRWADPGAPASLSRLASKRAYRLRRAVDGELERLLGPLGERLGWA